MNVILTGQTQVSKLQGLIQNSFYFRTSKENFPMSKYFNTGNTLGSDLAGCSATTCKIVDGCFFSSLAKSYFFGSIPIFVVCPLPNLVLPLFTLHPLIDLSLFDDVT